MSRNGEGSGGGKAMSMLAAVLVGVVLGLVIAGGVAWYVLKTPGPFTNAANPREQVKLTPDAKPAPVAKPAAEASAVAAASSVEAASAVADGKPRFEFYKVLAGKEEAAPEQPAAKSAKSEKKEAHYLQAGAFSNPDDADRLKARLAMLGFEATVQDATLPDKSVWHRVHLGPYKSAEEMNKAVAALKQNGINATPMRVQ
jgi:cell division protein FtsN